MYNRQLEENRRHIKPYRYGLAWILVIFLINVDSKRITIEAIEEYSSGR